MKQPYLLRQDIARSASPGTSSSLHSMAVMSPSQPCPSFRASVSPAITSPAFLMTVISPLALQAQASRSHTTSSAVICLNIGCSATRRTHPFPLPFIHSLPSSTRLSFRPAHATPEAAHCIDSLRAGGDKGPPRLIRLQPQMRPLLSKTTLRLISSSFFAMLSIAQLENRWIAYV